MIACTCGHLVQHGFRDALSWKEAELSGFCQRCQDALFIGVRDDGVHPCRYELRTGAVVAARRRDGRFAIIPFVFGAPGRPVGWEALSIVCAGPAPAPSLEQLSARLASARSFIGWYQVRVCSVRDFAFPPGASRYGPCAVVVARDAATLDAAATVSEELAEAGTVELDPLLRDRGVGGLDAFVARMRLDVGYYAAGVDPLRTCAWLLAALEMGRPDPTLFAHVLAPFRRPADDGAGLSPAAS